MENKQWQRLIIENMKSIFGFALTRLGNVRDAEVLASDIVYALLCAENRLQDEQCFYGYMWRTAENRYRDYLRRRQRYAGRTVDLDDQLADDSDFVRDEIIRKEELGLMRRELALLSQQYRSTTVLYYMEGFSCAEIAEKLNISTEMVKYYLFRARKIIREGMNMERLWGEKSYHPSGFSIDYWGPACDNPDEYREFQIRKIKGNILLAAYYSPLTIQEISLELGVALPYLEDEIDLLLKSGHLICQNDRYRTNIPIFTAECTRAIEEKRRSLTYATAERFCSIADEFLLRFGNRFANENLARWQKLLLCLHFSLMDSEEELQKRFSPAAGEDSPGIIWGRSDDHDRQNELFRRIRGIYNGCEADDGRGSVIAMNFHQTLNAQRFEDSMTTPIVCTAVDCYAYLPSDWQEVLAKEGYVRDGRANFPVWTQEEYAALRHILKEAIDTVTVLHRETSRLAAAVAADLAPEHIRRRAEYAGAVVYRFNAIEDLVNILDEQHWLSKTDDQDKPAICVIRAKTAG